MTNDLIERMARAYYLAVEGSDWDALSPYSQDIIIRGMRAAWAGAAEPGKATIITSCLECDATVTGEQVGWQCGTDFQWRCPEHKLGQVMHGAAVPEKADD